MFQELGIGIVVVSGSEYAKVRESACRLSTLHANWGNPREALELAGDNSLKEILSLMPRFVSREYYLKLLRETQEWETISRIFFRPNGINTLVNREQARAYVAKLMNIPAQNPEEIMRRDEVCKAITRLWP